ncbi:hypothetical protein EWM64_g8417 [Hericium alpestre]|uniref:DUF6534 domain-containing protein n=1 Tax=Hericium alpestre TaxID=135208 RepID=A0A4Y9ZLV0_9AGAM|nr:hypothetical protein EWM64_g8417 [Hericium alpestre]
MLYGISLTQIYIYYSAYKKDRLWMKAFIVVLFLCDTVNTVFDMVFIFNSLINHFGDTNYIQNANWVFGADPAMTGIIGAMVQLFFAWRVRVLTGSRVATGIIATTALLDCLGGLGTAVAIGFVPKFLEFSKFKPAVVIWLISAAVADVLITTILVMHLRKHKSGFSHTDDVVDKIIRMTVQTGLLTSIVAIIDCVLFLGDTGSALALCNYSGSPVSAPLKSIQKQAADFTPTGQYFNYNASTQEGKRRKSLPGKARPSGDDAVGVASATAVLEVGGHLSSDFLGGGEDSLVDEGVHCSTSFTVLTSNPRNGIYVIFEQVGSMGCVNNEDPANVQVDLRMAAKRLIQAQNDSATAIFIAVKVASLYGLKKDITR